MASAAVLILRTAGTNCDLETEHAWRLAGAVPERVHLQEIVARPERLHAYDILTLPGGFSYGDDIAAGRIFAAQLKRQLAADLRRFVEDGKLIFGICNGFQVLVQTGLLPFGSAAGQVRVCEVAANAPAGFQDRWVTLRAAEDTRCVFLEPGATYEMPIAHGEGRVVFRSTSEAQRAIEGGHDALRYWPPAEAAGEARAVLASAGGEAEGRAHWPAPDLAMPYNPNGSMHDLAGLCDETGRVFGLMPHPERFVDWTQHPAWTSTSEREPADGLRLFQRAVAAVR